MGTKRRAMLRRAAGLVAGCATWWAVLNGGLALLRAGSPDYALAEPEKAYTLTMLFVRLVVFSSAIAATSAAATLVAGDRRFAWITGGVILAFSIPSHLYPGYVWEDYPAWYHIVYLVSILPIAALAGRWVRRLVPASTLAASSA